MKRPVWLFSMDSDQFSAVPTTTGGLKAYYHHYGKRHLHTEIDLVHFLQTQEIEHWQEHWRNELLPLAKQALEQGLEPVVGFSFYTWNAEEFLALASFIRHSCPQLLIIAGGPHVQQAEDYLFDEDIDLVFMGEAEETFKQLLDCENRSDWQNIDGLAFLDAQDKLHKTPSRTRETALDKLPSALEVVALSDENGKPLYESIAYETSRGCPYKCAFCEWGTGAIGTKMYQYSMQRIESDWQKIIDAGIKNIWLADSNFGALKEDVEKTRLICKLKEQSGLPTTFATSWSKKHSPKVQEIVMLLHEHGLLPHYQLALQTLTPLALELSNRKNMSSNKYEPIAKQMAEEGVPIAAELIWGLPGDNLADFEKNLDKLIATFPNINIFGYTLLPGTEFYRRREEYKIDAIPVAGYGKAKGEYVVGCHTFDRDEGIEGYYLITAHIIFVHGHVLPLTTKFLSLDGRISVSPLLRKLLSAMVEKFGTELSVAAELSIEDLDNKMKIYEHRDLLYIAMINALDDSFDELKTVLGDCLRAEDADEAFIKQVYDVLALDAALCPRAGQPYQFDQHFTFNAESVKASLEAMECPNAAMFKGQAQVTIAHPAGVGDILRDPDGGSWLKGDILEAAVDKVLEEPQPLLITG